MNHSVCTRMVRAVKRFGTSTRSFHLDSHRPPQDVAAEWFAEGFSSKPDSINSLMNLIYTRASQNSVTPFNLFCRSTMERWTVKGLRIGTKDKNNRSVVLASGMQAGEHIPIGVALYTAAVLSQRPIKGVEVTVFPVLKPKEFELQWHNEQTGRTKAVADLSAENIKLSLEEYDWVVEGPLRSYAMKRGSNFVDFVMSLNGSGSLLHLKQNSIVKPFRQANAFLQDLPQSGPLIPKLALNGEQTLFEQLVSPPTIIVELRDKSKLVEEDQIAACAEELIEHIHNLVAETASTKVL